jgi:hypothetical protein
MRRGSREPNKQANPLVVFVGLTQIDSDQTVSLKSELVVVEVSIPSPLKTKWPLRGQPAESNKTKMKIVKMEKVKRELKERKKERIRTERGALCG